MPQDSVPLTDVQRFAQDMLKRNVTLLTGRFYQFPDEESEDQGMMELAPNPLDIRRVVKRHIDPEYDIPQIVDAVTEYLYNRIWMT